MAQIRKLAGQTFWYGVSSIVARFLNYLLTPYLTKVLLGQEYGEMSLVYAAIPFMNVIFAYGLETAYFRYSQTKEQEQKVYSTATISLIISTILLFSTLLFFRHSVAEIISLKEHPEYITWSALIIAMDAITSLAFAKLRFQGRPRKFAFVRVMSIVVNIIVVFFYLSLCPRLMQKHPDNILLKLYDPSISGVGYVIIANVVQSAMCFLLLWKEFFSFKPEFDYELWKKIMRYSLPLVIVGLGGVINETADRIMLGWWSTAPDVKFEVGAYSACYKLSILITLSVQAFRMAAEPFFFKVAGGENPQRVYARVMNFFVIAVSTMYLLVTLYLDIWKYFIQNKNMWVALKVVPILLLANMFLGIYYNLSIWFKLKNKTIAGAIITMIGAGITILINYLFIPDYGFMACAWATFACYGSMMLLSYFWGQIEYPIPYAVKKIVFFIALALAVYFLHHFFAELQIGLLITAVVGTILLAGYLAVIVWIEKEEFSKIPFLQKFF